MAAASRRSSCGPVIRSLLPSGKFNSSCYITTSSTSSSSASAFESSSLATRTSSFLSRSTSPTHVNVGKSTPFAPSVRFSLDRTPFSPNRNNQVVSKKPAPQRRICLCAPTTHPGSFRCSLHKNGGGGASSLPRCNWSRLDTRRLAMANSLVRIGAVERNSMKRDLATLVRPSPHDLDRRRENFQCRPSRLSVMSKAEDL